MIRPIFLLGLVFVSAIALGEEPPVIPIGLDSYRMWNHWAYQRIGARTYIRSTYDRRGGNEGADASHFLYQLSDDYNVTLDVAGPGILYFARYNHWHGSPWHYNIDGHDQVVMETSTANPLKPVEGSTFMPREAFPIPLAWTWSQTKGADLMWVPLPFEKSFQMAYSRTHYGTGYYIYDQYVRGIRLSQRIRAWKEDDTPARDVLELIDRAGTDLVPKVDSREGRRTGIRQQTGTLALQSSDKATFALETASPQMLRALEFTVQRDKAIEFGRMRLRVTWDGLPCPSVDAPIALFFGTGTFYNRDEREYLVKSFPIVVKFEAKVVRLACYFPMAFFKSARFELINDTNANLDEVNYALRYAPYKDPANYVGYFHATYRDHPTPEPGRDLVLLDTHETEGGGDWSGSLIGTSFIFTHDNNLSTLEGDPRFFFDDSQTPQAQGTGTEEWGGGGDYWGGRNMTLPFAGHPVGARNFEEAKCDEDKIHSAYRFLLADLMPFGKNARIQLEHGGENQSTEHYETVTYWYGAHSPSLLKTDTLQLGDVGSEMLHAYVSPAASPPYEITSRYELSVDTIKKPTSATPQTNTTGSSVEIYPAQSDQGRKMAGTSEFVLKLEPRNFGVLLRRKLDYAFPNQRAEVYVASANSDTNAIREADWKLAGIWYLAGANTCVYSNPKDELGATQHIVRTSNRRFRDDEFLVPRDLTEGRRKIHLRIKFTPVKIPLFPGQPLPELAWSEIRYDAYCFVMPKFQQQSPAHR